MHVSRTISTVSLALVVLTGCYHATIETGAPASAEVISKSFASGWIYGLVPPATVETAAKCPNGVSKVETKLSFLNQLVSGLTFGIYTPMAIKVTCAARRAGADDAPDADIIIEADAAGVEIREAFARAGQMAVDSGRAVWVEARAHR